MADLGCLFDLAGGGLSSGPPLLAGSSCDVPFSAGFGKRLACAPAVRVVGLDWPKWLSASRLKLTAFCFGFLLTSSFGVAMLLDGRKGGAAGRCGVPSASGGGRLGSGVAERQRRLALLLLLRIGGLALGRGRAVGGVPGGWSALAPWAGDPLAVEACGGPAGVGRGLSTRAAERGGEQGRRLSGACGGVVAGPGGLARKSLSAPTSLTRAASAGCEARRPLSE